MLRITVFFSFILILNSCGNSGAEVNISLIPVQFSQNGRWGYIGEDGGLAIDTIFEKMPTYFRGEFAIAQKSDGVYDYIDTKGEWAGLELKAATMFSESAASGVKKNSHPLILDNELTERKALDNAEEIGGFCEKFARYRDYSGKWGYVNANGGIAVKPQYEFAGNFCEGLAYVIEKENGRLKTGFIDNKGKFKISFKEPSRARKFCGGLAALNSFGGWVFINSEGKKISPKKGAFEAATDFVNGYASVKEDGKWGLINTKGEIVIKPKYANPLFFYNGLAAVDINGTYGFMDINQNLVIEPQYAEVAAPFVSSYSIVRIENYFLIDKDGNKIGPELFNVNKNYQGRSYDMALLQSDYFDSKTAAKLIVNSVKKNSLNGIAQKMGFNSFILGVGEKKLDSADLHNKKKNLSVLGDTLRRELIRDARYYTNYPAPDTLWIDRIVYYTKLKGKASDKGPGILKEIANLFKDAGYKQEKKLSRYFLKSSDARCELSYDYGEIAIDYKFIPKKDSSEANVASPD